MPLTVHRITNPTDIPTLVTLYFSSFQNAHSLACWPRDDPRVRKWWEDMLLHELSDPEAFFFKVVDDDAASSSEHEREERPEEILAWAKWCSPDAQPDQDLQWPEGADRELCDETFGAWEVERKRIMGGRKHWCTELITTDLEMLATDPKHQGKGAGSALMSWGLNRADQDGSETYLEASPAGESLYRRFGFEEVAKLDTVICSPRVNGGRETMYRNLFMVRRARRVSK